MIAALQIISAATLGFSIVSAFLLFSYYISADHALNRRKSAAVSCASLLLCLVGLQVGHLATMLMPFDPLSNDIYARLLFVIPALFFLFSREILDDACNYGLKEIVHFMPLFVTFLLSPLSILPLAFFTGTLYCLWFSYRIYETRKVRHRFKYELFFYVLFSVIAVVVFALSFWLESKSLPTFYAFYGQSISLSFILISYIVLTRPALLDDVTEAVRTRSTPSTLQHVDCDAMVSALTNLLESEELYRDPSTTMNSIAQRLGISAHQLSELVNTKLETGFSTLIRQYRVNAAKRLLLDEPDSTILAIAMDVGFKSQSNFYTAFRELEGMSPGQFRKNNQK